MAGIVVLAVVVVVPVMVIAFGSVPRRYVSRFLGRYPIRLTAGNGPMVVQRLARVRAARTVGGLGGAVLGIASTALGVPVNLLLAIAVGYLLGAIGAELPSRRDRVAARAQVATLVPRRIDDYVPRWVVVAPAVVVVVTLTIVVVAATGSQRPNLGYDPAWRSAVGIGSMLIASPRNAPTRLRRGWNRRGRRDSSHVGRPWRKRGSAGCASDRRWRDPGVLRLSPAAP